MRQIIKQSPSTFVALCLLLFLPVIVQAQEANRTGSSRTGPSGSWEARRPFAEINPNTPPNSIASRQDQAMVQLHNGLAQLESQRPRYDKAEKSFKRALELNPNLLQARFGLGYVYSTQGRDDEAEKVYRQMLRLVPESDSANIHFSLGVLYLKRGDQSLAQEELRILNQLDQKLAGQLKTQLDAGVKKP